MIRRTGRLTAALGAAALFAAGCGASDDTEPASAPDTGAAETTDATITEPADEPADDGAPAVAVTDGEITELAVTELVAGTGDPAESGDTVALDYVGVLAADGSRFDSSYGTGQPLSVVLGAGQVIPGFETGLEGVREGERRQIDIPSDLAYGDQGAGDVIPPGAAISFVVDVRSITPWEPPEAPPMADPAECPATDGSEPRQQEFDAYPPFCIDVEADYTAEIVTNLGELTVALDPVQAPRTVNSFVALARHHYFDDTECHRAIPGFVVQCGDPTATGTGGPGYRYEDELPRPGQYEVGSLAMANSGPDTNGSQFFIITGPDGAALPPAYTLFGEVVEGLDTTVAELDAVANPDDNGVPPLEPIIIESVTITGP